MRAAGLVLALVCAASACKRREADAPRVDEAAAPAGPQPELVVQAGASHFVRDVEFSPDGRYLAMASVDGLLRVADVRQGKEWRSYAGAVGPLYAVAWSPDGTRVAAGGHDKTVHVWDAASGAEVAALPGHTGWVGALEFSPDGKSLASAATLRDVVVAVWDLEGKSLRHALTHTHEVHDLAWTRDGRSLVTSGQAAVVWNVESGGRLGEIAVDSSAGGRRSLRLAPDGALLAIAGKDRTVHVYDVATWAEASKRADSALVGWQADGALVVHSGGEVVQVDPRSGARRAGVRGADRLGEAELTADGRLAAAIDDMEVELVEVASGARVWRIESEFFRQVGGPIGNAAALLHVAWSPTAPVLATGGFDGVLRVLDLRRGVTPRTTVAGPTYAVDAADRRPGAPDERVGEIEDVEFTGDGAHVLTRDFAGVSRWDVRSLERARRYEAQGASAQAVAPDGKLLAVAHADSVISIFDVATGARLRSSASGGHDAGCQQDRRLDVASTGLTIGGLGWSADGRQLFAVYQESGTMAVFDAGTLKSGGSGCVHGSWVNAVAYSDARDRVAIGGGLHTVVQMAVELVVGDNSVIVLDAADARPRVLGGHRLAVLGADFSPDGRLLATGGADRVAKLWDLQAGAEVATIRGHGAEVSSVAFSHDNKFLATASHDLSVKVWAVGEDPRRPQEVATLVTIGPDGYVLETPDHYYTASRQGFSSVSFRLGATVVPVELFDLRLNRPDLVLRRFGYAPADLLALYEKAHRKRLKKMGLTEGALRPEFHVPTVRLTGEVPLSTAGRSVSLSLVAEDSRHTLDRLQVHVNDVPIHGSAGIDLRRARTRRDERTVEVALLPGRNKIQVAALNSAGNESLRETVTVVSTAPPQPATLYVVAVGVSRYADVRMNLKYAAKDAQDIASLFRERGRAFDRVEVVQILDGEAKRETILAARERLAASTVADQVVVFVAGHGMLDQNLDYYFVTHDFDRERPPARGLAYDQLESLLDGIPARRKLMMMDTCHSGEVDDEAMRAPPPLPGASGVKVTSDFRTFSYGGEVQSPDRSGELLGQLFADLRRGSGAAVISSASGSEFALESARWQNGVFTYAVLQGLMSGAADRDKDGTIRVSELRDHVVEEVHRLTRGAQTPTSRRENLEFDFPVF